LPPGLEVEAEPSHHGDRAAPEAGEDNHRDLSTYGCGGVLDGAELLVALPGHVDFAVGIAGLQAPGELGLLPFGQVLYAVAEYAADLVERIVLVAAVAKGVLLDAAPDFIDDLGAQPDYMEGIQHRDRVGQLVTNRVRIATERIQRGFLDGGGETVGLVLQPGLVGGPRPADDRVEKPGVEASVLVTGQIDHNRHRPVGADSAGPPDVLIDTQGLDSGKAFGPRDLALASVSIADQAVCQATPR
jgi:hypothetical protein